MHDVYIINGIASLFFFFFFFFEKENCKSLDIDYIDCGFKVWYIDLLVQA